MTLGRHVRGMIGATAKDALRYQRAIRSQGSDFLTLCNRGERLIAAPDGDVGFDCDWPWTTDLSAPKFLPSLGRSLLRRALAHDPIRLTDAPGRLEDAPDVTFIIGHRGQARLPHLQFTLKSIAGQSGVNIECIVVEQDIQPSLRDMLPPWVRYVHAPPPASEMPYCRSWAFNVGLRHARAPLLVLHDNDILVPERYAHEALRQFAKGYEVINLKRFIFSLSQQHTESVFASTAQLADFAPLSIGQNLEGGGSLVIARQAYEEVGGLDESFIGWGGEDNEFWERAQTRKHWPFSSMSLVHLWHPAQAGKGDRENETLKRYYALAQIDPATRIAALMARQQGQMSGPCGWVNR